VEFNEENLDSNNELIHGVLNPLVVDEGMVEELQSENDLSFEELEPLSVKNRMEIERILEQSAQNKDIAIQHNREITERREKLFGNRQDVKAMRGSVGREVDYADIFLA
jgi:L-rhamnose isomerase